MDMRPAQCVADAFAGIEVGVENLSLFRRRDLCVSFGRRIGERAADAYDRLGSLRRVDEDADLRLEGLTHVLERQSFSGGETIIRFVGGGVHRDFSSL